MRLDDFIYKYYDTAIEYDGKAYYECVDLIKQYLDEVFGLKPGYIGNGEDYYNDFEKIPILSENFIKIPINKIRQPLRGDIVVWGLNHSPVGHVSIATGYGDLDWFESYDQNWHTRRLQTVDHTYKGVVGILRPKGELIWKKKKLN